MPFTTLFEQAETDISRICRCLSFNKISWYLLDSYFRLDSLRGIMIMELVQDESGGIIIFCSWEFLETLKPSCAFPSHILCWLARQVIWILVWRLRFWSSGTKNCAWVSSWLPLGNGNFLNDRNFPTQSCLPLILDCSPWRRRWWRVVQGQLPDDCQHQNHVILRPLDIQTRFQRQFNANGIFF